MRLLNAKEVAEILQVNTQRVYELTRQGILPSLRIGARQIRFEETRLLRWIENGGGLNAIGLGDELIMADPKEIDLRLAIIVISDVVQNRSRPLREFDQIYI